MVDDVKSEVKNLAKLECLFSNSGSDTANQESQFLETINNLNRLPFSVLQDLMKDDDSYLALFAFRSMCHSYLNSISDSEKVIFDDTTHLVVCSAEGRIKNLNLTIGQFSKHIYFTGLHQEELKGRQSIVEDSIRSFILKNARYPNTYKSKKFQAYKVFEEEALEEYPNFRVIYEIQHFYTLMNSKGKLEEVSSWFVLTADLQVNLIDEERSFRFADFEPDVGAWLKKFGAKQKN